MAVASGCCAPVMARRTTLNLANALPAHAAASAAWYWASRRIDNIAEPNDDAAFLAVTRKINGGVTGLADRCERWALARRFVGGGK